MRAAFRRLRSQSQDPQPEPIKVSLYEDTVQRVPPTPGLRPLHGSIPEKIRLQAAQHLRSGSLTSRQSSVRIADPKNDVSVRPMRHVSTRSNRPFQSVPMQTTVGVGHGYPRRDLGVDQSQIRPPSQPTHYTQPSYSHLYNEDIANRNMSPPSTSRAASIRSKMSNLGAVYSEDVADRNIARERNRSRAPSAASTIRPNLEHNDTAVRKQPVPREQSQSRSVLGRRSSPYSSAQIYRSPVASISAQRSQEFTPQGSSNKPASINGVARQQISAEKSGSIRSPRSEKAGSSSASFRAKDIQQNQQDQSVPARHDSYTRFQPQSALRQKYPPQVNGQKFDIGSEHAVRLTNGTKSVVIAPESQEVELGSAHHAVSVPRQRIIEIGGLKPHTGSKATNNVDEVPSVHAVAASSRLNETSNPSNSPNNHTAHDLHDRLIPQADHVKAVTFQYYVPSDESLSDDQNEGINGQQFAFPVVEPTSRESSMPPPYSRAQPRTSSSNTHTTDLDAGRPTTAINTHLPTNGTRITSNLVLEPGSLEVPRPEKYGIAPAKVPRRASSLNRHIPRHSK